jgi:aminoglycoside 3-N-acetyltransferase
MNELTGEQIEKSLRELGMGAGDTVFLHSSLSSLGVVKGGSDTVVDSFLEVLNATGKKSGPRGTLVVPAFTFSLGSKRNVVFDPQNDPSEMGLISETVRKRPGALRSLHLHHSVSAFGSQAERITSVHGHSAWAGDGPFYQLYVLDAVIILLGVPYIYCTFFHVIEQMVQVPYRHFRYVPARVRDPSGRLWALPLASYNPDSGWPGNDFNKFGSLLEERELSRVGSVGNAVARIFRARQALDTGVDEYRRDKNLFLRTGGDRTSLKDGIQVGDLPKVQSVVDPRKTFRAVRKPH